VGEALSKRRQEILNVIAGFRLMDDDFMSAVFQDNMECAALTLQIILGKPDLAEKESRFIFSSAGMRMESC